MTFLNPILLLGLAVVALPIIIHILNRRRAVVVDWGAMKFLEESLASRNRRILIEEILLMALRCLLLALLVFALARPRLQTGRLLAGKAKDPQDVAIVLDGSLSMELQVAGKSNFARAVEEARHVLKACRGGDAAAVILAGPTAQAVVPAPLSDLEAVGRRLDDLAPAGGSMGVLEALHAAVLALAEGGNAVKKIVLITDGQRIGWDLEARQRWQFLAEAAGPPTLATRPLVVVRTLAPPPQWRNAVAANLSFSRAVVGADRAVKINVTVANTGAGTGAVEPERVDLAVDGQTVESRSVDAIAEGGSASVTFEHRFETPGPHVAAAEVVCDDDLPADNTVIRALDVREELPVLVIQGRPSAGPMSGPADYLVEALAPRNVDDDAVAPPAATGTPGAPRRLIRPTVVAAPDVATIKGLADYDVVMLADVSRLPGPTVAALGRYVAAGGGLLVAPGQRVDKVAYDNWQGPDHKRLLGCRLSEFRVGGEGTKRFVRVAANTLDHPALRLLADPVVSDVSEARIRGRWALDVDDDPEVAVGAFLDSGEPFLVERKCGKGFVLTLAVPLDVEHGNLPVLDCYVPLVHEVAYYLAAPARAPRNIQPGQQIVHALPPHVRPPDVVEVTDPTGVRSPATLRRRGAGWQASFARTATAGLYRLHLPAAAKPKAPTTAAAGTDVPFVVLADPGESSLELLTADDLAVEAPDAPTASIGLARAGTLSELTAAVRGGAPGREIWRYAALALLALLLAEIAATRAITHHRQAHLAEGVDFGVDQGSVERFRTQAAGRAKPQEVA